MTEIIEGNFGRANGELRKTQKGQDVFGFSVVVTPRRKVGNDWVDDESIWTECTLWGPTAKSFAQAVANGSVRGGTPLIIIGTRRARQADAYVNKNGQEVPARIEQSINVDSVGVQFMPYLTITGTAKPDGSATGGGQAPAANHDGGNAGNVFGSNVSPKTEVDVNDIFAQGSGDGGDPFSVF